MKPCIIVLDFGGQYTHLIANRIRRLGGYSEISPPDIPKEQLTGVRGIILSGGPASVYASPQPSYDPDIFTLNIPLLGICYGHQLLALQFGGEIRPGSKKEYGVTKLQVESNQGIFQALDRDEEVWMSHGDAVYKLPPGFVLLGQTTDCPIAAMANLSRKIYGLQFHPEVTHTPCGMKILEAFISECGCERTWTTKGYMELAINQIKDQVGERNVFLLVSGGVDSSVAFALLSKALGAERVCGLLIDNGFMRKDEVVQIGEYGGLLGRLMVVDASEQFLQAVKGEIDPEKKRRIIGEVFIQVQNETLNQLGFDKGQWMLGQGTIYPDTIESGGTEQAARIKTHHNRVEVVQELIAQGRVIEPLASLYKDEVREVGLQLKLPADLLWRHPFPGPGLAVRALCAKGEDYLPGWEKIEHQVDSIARKSQLEARLLPIRTVGVQGDSRTYTNPVALIGKADWRMLEKVSTRITNNIAEVNRVIHLVTPARLPRLAVKSCYLTKERLDLLRQADFVVTEQLYKENLSREIWQMPVILIPLSSDGEKESIVLRPVCSADAMTARFAEIPHEILRRISELITGIKGIEAVFYDVTHKPPGTIEWE